jgi:zinc protease
VKTQLVTQALVERQTPLGKGEALGEAIVLRGNARRANDELAELQAVTPADVQRVMRKYITGAPQVTIEYTQQAAAMDGAGRVNAAIPAVGVR